MMGVVKLERVQVICTACGQQVEAIARDGWVRGYCAIAGQFVDFQVEKLHSTDKRVEMPTVFMPMKQGRDSRGHFVKGNVPQNKRGQSQDR
jgi:hypothetical protein